MSSTSRRRPRVELFTHPVCGGCREASAALAQLAEAGVVELVTWSLATPSGRARALGAGVSTVPTALLGSTRRSLDSREALGSLLDDLRAGGRVSLRAPGP